MKRLVAFTIAAALVTSSLAVLAQARPNFAGKWTLVPNPNAPAPTGRGRGLGQAFTATQDEKTLTVITSNPPIGQIKAVYNLDGSESKNPITFFGTTVDRTSKVKWDGARLIVTSTSNFQGNATQTTQVWSLDASGTLTVDYTSNASGTPTTTKAQYKKS